MDAIRSPLRLPVTLFGAIVVLFHLLAMLFPSGVNWGFHHLAFLPDALSVSILLFMVVALIPKVQDRIVAGVEAVKTQRKGVVWTTALVLLAILFWFLRQHTFFLGDGYLVIRNLSGARSVSDLPAPFPTAPLSAFMAFQIREVLSFLHAEPAAQLAWQVQSITCGLIAIPLAFKLAPELIGDRRCQWTVALFLVVGGALQLFCGYVETYPPAYVATMLFVWLSLRYFAGKGSLFGPLLSFGLLFTLHFGMLSLLPALCVLVAVALRRKEMASAALAPVAGIGLVFLILLMCGYALHNFLGVLLKGGTYFLPLAVHDNWQTAYALLSPWHAVDLVNEGMLLSPFLLILVPLTAVVVLRRETRMKPQTLFLGLGVLGAVAWVVMTNFEVGMSRDWDVMTPLSVFLLAFALFGIGLIPDERRHAIMAGMVVVTLLHTIPWIIVNNNEDRAIARDVLLQDNRVRSQRAVAYASEDLAGFYRDRKQYAEALPFLEKTVAIDSTNARRWLSLANVYQLARQNDDATHAYEESIHYGIRDKAAFFNLGVLYYNHRRLDDAILSLQRAAAIDSADTVISSNLALMRARQAEQEKIQR